MVSTATLNRIAVACGNVSLTQFELGTETTKFVQALRRRGLKPGDSIAWLLENCIEFATVTVGGMRGGMRCLALNTHVSPSDVTSILETLQPKAVIVSSEQLKRDGMRAAFDNLDLDVFRVVVGNEADGDWAHFASLLETEDGLLQIDEAEAMAHAKLLLLSGGSTGCPKIVVHGEGEQPEGLDAFMPGPGDSVLVSQPMYHSAPLMTMLSALKMGATTVILRQWDTQEALWCIEKYRVTRMFMVPTQMSRILSLPYNVRSNYDLSSLRIVTHGAAPCSVAIKSHWLGWLSKVAPDCRTLELYGMSEMFGFTLIWDREWLQKRGSVGRAVGCTIVIRNEAGEEVPTGNTGIVWFVRNGDRMAYLGNPGETGASYAVRNGRDEGTAWDMGYVDEDGFLFLNGRAKDMIVSGGANIYPIQTEELMCEHPAVADVAVYGVSDPDLGQVLEAAVELRDGYEPTLELEESLKRFIRGRLGSFRTPRRIVFLKLPRLDTGKINKNTIRKMVGASA